MICWCDGCHKEREVGYTAALGHTMRYCAECMEVWADFKKACDAEAKRSQALLDLWERDMRSRLPLQLTPLDMPALVADTKGRALILG